MEGDYTPVRSLTRWQVWAPLLGLAATPLVARYAARGFPGQGQAVLAAVGWGIVLGRAVVSGCLHVWHDQAPGSQAAKATYYVGVAALQRFSIGLAVGYALAAYVLGAWLFVFIGLAAAAFWRSMLVALLGDAQAQLIDLSLLNRLRRLRGQRTANPFPPGDYRHAMWEAVNYVQGKQKVIANPKLARNFRPLELDEKMTLGSALAALPEIEKTAPKPAEEEAVTLERGSGDAQAELDQAARDQRARNEQLGIKEREHYYGAAERLAAGEVDRNYDVKQEEKLPELRPEEVPKSDENEEEVWEVE